MYLRKLTLTIIAFFIFLTVNAQEAYDTYSAELETISANIPEDQVFLHTDRNFYSAGDTIFFQSYIQDRELQKVQTASNSLYVLLQNPVKEIIDSARFKINASIAPGYLTLPDTVSPGFYRMTAYTSLMQNFDPKFCHTTWLRVDELNQNAVHAVFLFDKESYSANDTAEVEIRLLDQMGDAMKDQDFTYTLLMNDSPGEYYRVRTNAQGTSTLTLIVSDSMYKNNGSIEVNIQNKKFAARKTIPKRASQIDLRFLPEGGTYTYGVKQRLAFNAVGQDGEQLFVAGVVKNSQGQIIDSIKSGALGPGILDFTPVRGEKYHAEIQEYPQKIFELPSPSDVIQVLRTDYGDQSVRVQISCPNAVSENNYLVFRKNNQVLAFEEIDSTYKAFKFDTKKLPRGTAGFLLLDKHLNPVAERMVFINPEKKVYLDISTSKKVYKPEQEAEIHFSLDDALGINQPAVFSVTVVDSVTALYPNLLTPNIEETFLFDQQFYNNLPKHVKFHGLSNMNREELDVLLLTYGWKKFTWESTTGQNKQAERIYYDMLKVMIDDNFTNREARKYSEINNPLYLMSVEDMRVFELTQIDNKSYYFLFDSLGQDVNNIMITPGDTILRYVSTASIKFPVNQDYYQSVASIHTEPLLKTDDTFSIISDYNILTNRTKFIEEVSVTESRRKAPEYVNEHEKTYMNFSTQTLDQEDIEASFDLESLLRKLHPIKIGNLGSNDPWSKGIALRYTKGVQLDPALFVVDGNPVGTDYYKLEGMSPESIHSVTALRGPYGFQRYGPDAVGGVVFIETKQRHAGGEYAYEEPLPERGDLGKVINLFRPNIEFYIPAVNDISDNPQNWLRPTLFWNPGLVFDGRNLVTIKYPNHLKKGTVLLKVNGVTEDSRPFYGEYRYEIK